MGIENSDLMTYLARPPDTKALLDRLKRGAVTIAADWSGGPKTLTIPQLGQESASALRTSLSDSFCRNPIVVVRCHGQGRAAANDIEDFEARCGHGNSIVLKHKRGNSTLTAISTPSPKSRRCAGQSGPNDQLRGRCSSGDRTPPHYQFRAVDTQIDPLQVKPPGQTFVSGAQVIAFKPTLKTCLPGRTLDPGFTSHGRRTKPATCYLTIPFPPGLDPGRPTDAQTENDDPQPQVVVAFGLRITNCDPSIPSV